MRVTVYSFLVVVLLFFVFRAGVGGFYEAQAIEDAKLDSLNAELERRIAEHTKTLLEGEQELFRLQSQNKKLMRALKNLGGVENKMRDIDDLDAVYRGNWHFHIDTTKNR